MQKPKLRCKEGQKIKFYITTKKPNETEVRIEYIGIIKTILRSNFETMYRVITEDGQKFEIWNKQIIEKL